MFCFISQTVICSVSIWVAQFTTIELNQSLTKPTNEEKIQNLIELLGHPAFKVREQASRDLETFGIEAKPALIRAILENKDAEIQVRCQALLPRIELNFCWSRAKVALGGSAARNAFDTLYDAEVELWTAFVYDSDNFDELYRNRVQDLINGPPNIRQQSSSQFSRGICRYKVTEESLITFMILGTQCQSKISPETLRSATVLFIKKWGRSYAAAKDTPAILRKSYVAWSENIAPLPIEYEGDKKLELARATLLAAKVSVLEKQDALLTVAKAKDKKDDTLIAALLNDDTICDTIFKKGIKTQVQLRDIALAATIYRAGKDPVLFGFNNLKMDSKRLFLPSSLGFSTDMERTAAFRAWSEATNSQP
ncbi:MAG: hypothetical protein R3B84_10970 [Zavarzinella sp.]